MHDVKYGREVSRNRLGNDETMTTSFAAQGGGRTHQPITVEERTQLVCRETDAHGSRCRRMRTERKIPSGNEIIADGLCFSREKDMKTEAQKQYDKNGGER